MPGATQPRSGGAQVQSQATPTLIAPDSGALSQRRA